jgi:hypothetical protein
MVACSLYSDGYPTQFYHMYDSWVRFLEPLLTTTHGWAAIRFHLTAVLLTLVRIPKYICSLQ